MQKLYMKQWQEHQMAASGGIPPMMDPAAMMMGHPPPMMPPGKSPVSSTLRRVSTPGLGSPHRSAASPVAAK